MQDDDDLFRPLSAKATKPRLSVSGRVIEGEGRARAAEARGLKASINNRHKYAVKPKGKTK